MFMGGGSLMDSFMAMMHMNDLLTRMRSFRDFREIWGAFTITAVLETLEAGALEIERLRAIVVEDTDYRTKSATEIERLNCQYKIGLDAWKANNAFQSAQIERLLQQINEQK
jgi:hypothetical protein